MIDLFTPTPRPTPLAVTLQGPTDLAGFRHAARALLARQVLPSQVSWHCKGEATSDLFGDSVQAQAVASTMIDQAPAISVPAEFLRLCESVILHTDPNRFGLLYRILWRLAHEPTLRHDPLDADRVAAHQMSQAVRRDMHKMKAFVRFRTVQDDIFQTDPESGLLHVAWFEPEHHIVKAVAPFFARRFTQMRWAVLTPECSARWDGAKLHLGPGANRSDAPPADAGEQLWLTYYQHIFNPARLKFKMMQKEMPRKYWHNLPEAVFISSLAASASARRMAMIDETPSTTKRRIPSLKMRAAGRDD